MRRAAGARLWTALIGVLVVLVTGSLGAPAVAVDAATTSAYVSVAPQRILDTRTGLGAPKARPAAGAQVHVQVTGQGGVPASGVTAVTLNVTVTSPAQVGYVQALPTGSGTLGASSNVNVYYLGQTASNLVTVPVGDGGMVTLYDVAGGHLIADVFGYYTQAEVSGSGRYQGVTPTRVLDSRNRTGLPPVPGPTVPPHPGNVVNCGDFARWSDANAYFWTYYPHYGDVAGLDGDGDLIPCETLPGAPGTPSPPPTAPAPNPTPKLAPREVVTLPLAGVAGVPPTGASAVALTVTATQSSGPGFVQVLPSDAATPLGTTSNVNLTAAGQTVANLVVVPLGADGAIRLYNSSGTHLIADVVGWFTDASATPSAEGLFVPVEPQRLADTRSTAAVPSGGQLVLDPAGKAGVPATGAAGLFANVTATSTTGPGYLQVFPTGQGTPGASSSVNFTGPGQTIATANIASLGVGGQLTIYTPTRTHVIVDVFGYFTGPGEPVDPGDPGVLAGLVVAPANTTVPYDRDQWEHWVDADGDCQDTRDEVLIAESLTPVTLDGGGCNVVAGTWFDPWGATTWTLPSDVDIDHTVALHNAHVSGGWAWDAATRRAFANDLSYPGHLDAMEDNLNQAKGSLGPEAWRPPATDSWCEYATDWATIKTTWSLTVTLTEYDALAAMLATC